MSLRFHGQFHGLFEFQVIKPENEFEGELADAAFLEVVLQQWPELFHESEGIAVCIGPDKFFGVSVAEQVEVDGYFAFVELDQVVVVVEVFA